MGCVARAGVVAAVRGVGVVAGVHAVGGAVLGRAGQLTRGHGGGLLLVAGRPRVHHLWHMWGR